METMRLIIECSINEFTEKKLKSLGTIVYTLPIIDSYVIEIPEKYIHKLKGLKGIKAVSSCTHISAQMYKARNQIGEIFAGENYPTGTGIGIAILDTGISPVSDFTLPENRIDAFMDFVNNKSAPYDDNAHGTHVSGIAAGSGHASGGKYRGIAPGATVISLKVLDKDGNGNVADMLAGIQWLVDNRRTYNIRVANLSVGTKDIGNRDPLVKACEYAWDNGIIIVTAAGNNGPRPGSVTSPGISRKVITVGASDDNNPVRIHGNSLVNFSGRGPTSECIVKPDIIAPGTRIVSCLSKTPGFSGNDDDHVIISENYVEMSGTSMAAPVVSGAVALLLELRPELTPNQVKLLIKNSARNMYYPKNQQGWGILDIDKLLLIGEACNLEDM